MRFAGQATDDKIIALAGNPNVGKSTVFNRLTGLNQHTGNWPGKTVTNAHGKYRYKEKNYILVDIPGTYSLTSNSADEEAARDFICFGEADVIIIVVDATCVERNLNLVLQTLEVTSNVIVCVNLMDEAKRKKIKVDLSELSRQLGIPVIGTSARSGNGMTELMDAVYKATSGSPAAQPLKITYDETIEQALCMVEEAVKKIFPENKLPCRWLSMKLLDGDSAFIESIQKHPCFYFMENEYIKRTLEEAWRVLAHSGIDHNLFRDRVVSSLMNSAENICNKAVIFENIDYTGTDRRIDSILTSRWLGIPIMIGLLGLIFWITLAGANIPSRALSSLLFGIERYLTDFFSWVGLPQWVSGVLVTGVYRTLAWVVSVMLPPMAIFFPLFTLLEDIGYLPRVAFNLDNFFKKACTHGKQALTMCMGFGCNAAAIIGCRIIDSPRERLIATITNCFVPCNGRFPTLIAIIAMFFTGFTAGVFKSFVSSFILTGVIILGISMTLLISKILSATILKGLPSSFALELPPYRKPQTGRVILRSVLDRTLFVLGRAVTVAAPAGLVIWVLANVDAGGMSLLSHCAVFLDPFAKLIGLDGYILLAFILGFPANEIVVPIIIMSYMAAGSILEIDNLTQLKGLLISHGWTWLTALCVMLFSLMHWPCGTTCRIIKKETQSWKWTMVSILVPTITGTVICFVVATIARLLGLV